MASGHPLSDETLRILRAAADGRLRRNDRFRWIIDDEGPPVRAEREWLQRRGMLAYASGSRDVLVVTDAGRRVLAAEGG